MCRASLLLLLLLLSASASGSAHAGYDDAAALLAFKAAAVGGGGDHDALSSWNGSAGLCGWEGVACSRHRGRLRRVVALSLPSLGLAGTLSPAVGNLSFLQTLNLTFNWLHGDIPASIGRLRRLRNLDLSINTFSGELPSNLTSCISLTSLNLGGNNLTGHIPVDLGDTMTQLQYLYLNNNSFTGAIPASLANLTSLINLYLRTNSLEGPIPPGLGSNTPRLQIFDIYQNKLQGMIPESIGKLGNLTELDLNNNGLSGLIPSSIGNLTKLIKLFMRSNKLEGPIPASIGKVSSLDVIDLSSNYLNGSIPKEILELRFWYLNLSHNSLSGPLPSEVGSLANLNSLNLSGNMLSGQMPSSIKNCIVLEVLLLDNNLFQGSIPESLEDIKGLRVLNLTMNKLSGRIPDALGSIHSLQELYLAYNNLSGPIPAVLQNLAALSKLNISFNDLQGGVPEEGIFRNLTSLSIVGNSDLCGGIPQLHLAPCSMPNKKVWSKSFRIAIKTTSAILFLALVIALIQCIYKKLERQTQKSQFLTPVIGEQFERVSYQALSNGTNGFSDENLIGKGGYGTVYKCTFHNEGTVAAVKVFNLEQSGSTRSFVAECEALRTVRHRCLMKIITCCSSINQQGEEFKALVFEFMPNGSLNGWLHPKSGMPNISNTLSFAQRIDIAVDVMDALDYLHNQCQPPIIHCDLKPSNILLTKDMSAQVGDFGISRILPEGTSKTLQNSNSTIGIRGSIGYVAPEYAEGSPISTLGDVYSLGILVLEIFTGRSPTDDMFRDSLDLHRFSEAALSNRILEIADPTVWEHGDAYDSNTRTVIQKCLVSVIELGISCSKQQPRERMSIRDAAAEMHSIRDAYLMFVRCNVKKEREVTIELQ